jgi:DNA-binding MarR family transcriptional regulator
MSKDPVSHLEDHLGYWLRTLSNCVHHSFSERLARYDISVAQWVVLCTLYHEKGLSLNQAVERIGVDKSALSRMVERLVKRGLVDRQGGKDRRFIQLDLTNEGRELVPQLAKLADENDAAFFQTMESEQQKNLLLAIQGLLAANDWDGSKSGALN